MNVVEKDRVISEMLRDELRRCREMAAELERVAAQLPRGSLGLRKKRQGAHEYTYHCLKYREGGKVVSRHVATDDVEALAKRLDERRRYEQEIRQLRKRISYLEKLLGVGELPDVVFRAGSDAAFPEEVKELLRTLHGVGFFEDSVPVYGEIFGILYPLRTMDNDFGLELVAGGKARRADLEQILVGLGYLPSASQSGVQRFTRAGFTVEFLRGASGTFAGR